MFDPISASIIGASTLAGLYAKYRASQDQANASREAGETINNATRETNALNQRIYDQSRQDVQPWYDAGVRGLGNLEDHVYNGMQPFTAEMMYQDPGYAFRMDEAMRRLIQSQSHRGKSGPAADRETARYFQGLASQEYGSAYDRYRQNYMDRLGALQHLSGQGQAASNQLLNAGQNYGNSMTNGIMTGANALASARLGEGDAWASGWLGAANTLNNGLSMYYKNHQGNQLVNALNGGARNGSKNIGLGDVASTYGNWG